MTKVAVVLVLLAALLVALTAAEDIENCFYRDCTGVPCNDVLAETCFSGKTMRCGCCEVCVVNLVKGQLCRTFVQQNAQCTPPLICGSTGVCEAIPYY